MTAHSNQPLSDSEKVCTKCNLHKQCRYSNRIDGRGARRPTYLFAGQNPGKFEDEQGEVFVGESGDLLLGVLNELGYDIEQCRFTNAVRCWSGEHNPTPTPAHIKACNPYLKEEIKKTKPRVIVMLGAVALKAVTGRTGITKLRGTIWEENGIYYVPTFHPAFLLRNRNDDRILSSFCQDLERAKNVVSEGIKPRFEPERIIAESYDEGMDMIKHFEEVEESIDHDYETHGNKKTRKGFGPDPFAKDARCIQVSFACSADWGVSIPLMKSDAPFCMEKGEKLIRRISLMNKRRNRRGLRFGAYNAVFDIMFPYIAHGVILPKLDFDPYLAHHLIDEELKMPSLKQLAWYYTDMGGYENELTEYCAKHQEADVSRGGSFDAIPYKLLGKYNVDDSVVTRMLREKFTPILEEEGLMQLLQEITLPASYPVMAFQTNGVRIDVDFAKRLLADYAYRIEELKTRARKLPDVKKYERIRVKREKKKWERQLQEKIQAGKRVMKTTLPEFIFEYNLGSRDQNRELLFDVVKLKPVEKTKRGKPSVNKDVLEVLRDEHPIIPLMEECATLVKFKGTYIEPFSKISSDSEFIFLPFYDLTGTATGRCSSDFQQLPRGSTNKDIRKLIISRFGNRGRILNIDFSQLEVRLFAIASKDKMLREIFSRGADAHTMTACWTYDYAPIGSYDLTKWEKMPKDKRKKIRDEIKSVVTFGVMYGRSAKALAADMGWTEARAQEFIDDYFGVFSGVREYIDYVRDFLMEYGWIKNMFGRKRRLPDAMSDNEHVRERALRQGVNFPIQSTGHDILLWCQYGIWKKLRKYKLKSLMCGEMHDSIVIDIFPSEAKVVAEIAKGTMEKLPWDWIDTPMIADAGIGPNLLELEDFQV